RLIARQGGRQVNHELARLMTEAAVDGPADEPLRLAFGLACANRVRHLLEDARAVQCLDALQDHVAGRCVGDRFAQARESIVEVARGHRGSHSIDGTAHAAVSATYSVANALAGRALDAANYAAYATVYAYGGYAISEPAAFTPEFEWQVAKWAELIRARVESFATVAQGSHFRT
ncbi:MAG: hypothetical protein ACXWJM_02225, partial [Ramlibacter sp.]